MAEETGSAGKKKKKKNEKQKSLKRRVIKVLIIVAIIIIIPVSVLSVCDATFNYIDLYTLYMSDMENILLAEVNSYKEDVVRAVQTGEKDPHYDERMDVLDGFVGSTTLTDIVVAVVDGDDMVIYGSEGFDNNDLEFGDRIPIEEICEPNYLDREEFLGEEEHVFAFLPEEDIRKRAEVLDSHGLIETIFLRMGVRSFIKGENGEPDICIFVYVRAVEIINNILSLIGRIFAVAIIVVTIIILMVVALSVKVLVNPIQRMAKAADDLMKESDSEMTPQERFGRNLFGNIKVKNKDEIGVLYRNLSEMEQKLGEYLGELVTVTAEKEKIGAELDVATKIQADMLPSIFPAFPGRPEFDLFASMDPAKEVGGDFYDFFLVDDDHLALVMADVSGKGVPAALFMVISKTMIKNSAQLGYSPARVLKEVNDSLCEGNESKLFVTVWIAIITISTGMVVEANGGHEHPAMKKSGGKFELIKYAHGPALGMIPNMPYSEREYQISKGDRIFVYTDGIPEAANEANDRYGDDRLLAILDANISEDPETVCRNVRDDITAFVGNADQFDDITMLCFDYNGADTIINQVPENGDDRQ